MALLRLQAPPTIPNSLVSTKAASPSSPSAGAAPPPHIDAKLVNVLSQFHDFHGWDLHALWDDIKFSTTHCTKIKRIALVGDKTWEKWMAAVCKPFTMAKIRYFDAAQIEAAKAWLREA